MSLFNLIFIFSLLQLAHLVISIRLIKVLIPDYGVKGGDIMLICEFDLENDPLMAVKWYKDQNEFFSFRSTLPPPHQITTFPVSGINVDISQSSLTRVVLKNVTLKTSGNYKCEVSADKPTYRTLSKQSDLIIYAPPEGDPVIRGIISVSKLGDRIQGNCTSYRSKPASSLTFYINDEKVEPTDQIEYSPIIEPGGLETSILGLDIILSPKYLKDDVMNLKCAATIGNAYWSTEKRVTEVTRHLQPKFGQKRHTQSGCAAFKLNFGGISLLIYGLPGFIHLLWNSL